MWPEKWYEMTGRKHGTSRPGRDVFLRDGFGAKKSRNHSKKIFERIVLYESIYKPQNSLPCSILQIFFSLNKNLYVIWDKKQVDDVKIKFELMAQH